MLRVRQLGLLAVTLARELSLGTCRRSDGLVTALLTTEIDGRIAGSSTGAFSSGVSSCSEGS